MTLRVIVCGGRDFEDYDMLKGVLEAFPIAEVISGGARGADSLGERYAKDNNLSLLVKKADWSQYGKSAGYRRNVEMADEGPDIVFAFPGGKGTQHMVDIAESRGITVVKVDE